MHHEGPARKEVTLMRSKQSDGNGNAVVVQAGSAVTPTRQETASCAC